MGDSPKRFFPAYLDLEGRLVVVVGSTPESDRKIRHLMRYGADITLIAPIPSEWALAEEALGHLGTEQRSFTSGDLKGAFIGLCYDTDPDVRAAFQAEADRLGCPVNVAGDHEASGFLLPGVVSRPPLQIAVSTGGMAPELAKKVRRDLAERYGEHWGAYVELFSEIRWLLFDTVDDDAERAELLASLAESDLEQRMAAGERPTAAAEVEALLNHGPREGEA